MESIEILAVVESVSNEKGIEEGIIFRALETAIASASLRHFHEDADISVSIDRTSGEYSTHRHWLVEDENSEDFHKETHITESDSKMNIGDTFSKDVDNIVFGRIETQAARQVMMQKVREAERDTIVAMFKSQDNSLMNGTVKRVTRDNIIVDIGNDIEAILPRDQLLPGEIYKINDRMRAVLQIKEIEGRGSQLMLSRTCPEMVTELFRIEVPEINEDIIEIRGIARDAGSRSKITVKTNDGRIDPVGACVGVKGSRIHGIVRELRNENIDVVNHTENMQLLISRALSPAKIKSVVLDEDNMRAAVYMDADQVSLAIGRGGYNIKLAGQLTGYEIDVFREGSEEDVELVEFSDEIDAWIIEEFKKAGLDTAKSVLEQDVDDLVKRTDLEEETIIEVRNVLKAEFSE